MRELAQALDEIFNGAERPKKVGFALLVFEFGSPAEINYISNARRQDMISALKELVARWEGRVHDTEGHA